MSMSLDGSSNEQDVVVESQGVKVVFDQNLASTLENARVNYSDKWFNKGFSLEGAGASSC